MSVPPLLKDNFVIFSEKTHPEILEEFTSTIKRKLPPSSIVIDDAESGLVMVKAPALKAVWRELSVRQNGDPCKEEENTPNLCIPLISVEFPEEPHRR